MKLVLSERSKTLLENFDLAAKDWGEEQEHGYGAAVKNAREEYEQCKKALEQRILLLETVNSNLKSFIKKHHVKE